MTRTPKQAAEPSAAVLEAVERAVGRMASRKDAPYFRHLLTELVVNNAIPVDLLDSVPLPAVEAGKTRFDQLYDAAMALVFPGYRRATLERLLGPLEGRGGKVWRVLLPDKFRMVHVLIRARTFQEAFALGCDYACRASLRMFGRIPVDLTIRVVFMSDRAIRRMLDIREANKTKKRRQLKLVGREFTERQVRGARLVALGHPRDPRHSVIKYADKKDLDRLWCAGRVRTSAVEHESFKRPPAPIE